MQLLPNPFGGVNTHLLETRPTSSVLSLSRCFLYTFFRSLSDIAENDRFGGDQITVAESRSLIPGQIHAPKFLCFLMSDRLLDRQDVQKILRLSGVVSGKSKIKMSFPRNLIRYWC